MRIDTRLRQGFSLVEVVFVVAILIIIAAIIMVGFQNFAGFQQYNRAVGDMQFVLDQTRMNARGAVNDDAHGIKFFPSSVTQFVGDAYSAVDPQNVDITYSLITITTDLTGGVDEVVFDKLTGLPSATGTVTVTGTNFNASTTLTISDAGVIE